MQTVKLEAAEWTQLMTILANSQGFAWSVTNPLLMKIGQQLQPQQAGQEPPLRQGDGLDLEGDKQPTRRVARSAVS